MATQPINSPVIDGFLYNPRLLYAPNRYLPLALEQLMPYRTENFQPRFYLAPGDPSKTIMAGLTLDTQLRITPGSVIVGFRFAVRTAGVNVNQVSYLIRDSNTQKNFTNGKSTYTNCAALVPKTFSNSGPFCILSSPYKVGGGTIVVSMANLNTTTDIACQMLLYVMEPVGYPTTFASGSIMVPPANVLAALVNQGKA